MASRRQLQIAIFFSILMVQDIFSTVTYYQSHEMTVDSAYVNMLRHSDTTSLTACASLCSSDDQCGLFAFGEMNPTCTLSQTSHLNCFVKDLTGNNLKAYLISNGNSSPTNGGEPGTYWSLADRSQWSVKASSIYNVGSYNPTFVYDGLENTGWSGHDNTPDKGKAWLEIKLGDDWDFWVKGFSISTKLNVPEWPQRQDRQRFTEIRVGFDEIPAGTPEDKVLCENQLCYQIGNDDTVPLEADCISLLNGNIVTVQKYDHHPGIDRFSMYQEVNVMVYCDHYRQDPNVPCVVDEVDHCSHKDLAVGKSPFVAQSSSDKSWDLTASSVANGQSLDAILDDDHGTEYSTVAPLEGPDKFPWIQIDLRTQHLVKSVHMYSKDAKDNLLFTEVRIGDNDVSGTTLGEKICVNSLCKVTGGGYGRAEEKHDCTGGAPIQGRYVTLQRYSHKDSKGADFTIPMIVAEVDIEYFE